MSSPNGLSVLGSCTSWSITLIDSMKSSKVIVWHHVMFHLFLGHRGYLLFGELEWYHIILTEEKRIGQMGLPDDLWLQFWQPVTLSPLSPSLPSPQWPRWVCKSGDPSPQDLLDRILIFLLSSETHILLRPRPWLWLYLCEDWRRNPPKKESPPLPHWQENEPLVPKSMTSRIRLPIKPPFIHSSIYPSFQWCTYPFIYPMIYLPIQTSTYPL